MKKWTEIREVITYIGPKSVLASVLVFLLTVLVTFAGGYQLYQYTKESILLQGQVNATRSAKEYDRYLIERETAVILAGHVVDGMIREHKSHEKIMEYLTEESQSIQLATDNDCTGLYGWINRQYCDGDGWVPDKDFVPTERPWYVETMAADPKDGEVVFIKPYLDEKTKTVMTSMATKLCDNESVLAIDVSLVQIQEITEELSPHTYDSFGLVLDKTGQVIAHSNNKEMGKNYRVEEDTLGAALMDMVFDKGKHQFELNYDGQQYIIYAEDIEGGWKSLSVINTEMFYRPLLIILLLLVSLMLLEGAIFVAIFFRLSAKNLAISIQNVQIAAVADMYVTICDIDIPHDRIREIRRGENYDMAHVIGEHQSAQKTLDEIYEQKVNVVSQAIMKPFIDITTLAERLSDKMTITEEFLNDEKLWCRGRFIVANRDKNGNAARVLWMVESIDEEKKHREKLKYLSETDRMTGLLNRATGEGKINDLLAQGMGGMLVMLDVDKFKSINDTLGHDVGDKVIIAVADAVGHAFRSIDVVMRLGGDEFVGFAPGVVSEEAGQAVIQRIFDNIVGADVEEVRDRRVYVSVGAAFCPRDEIMSFTELYKHADECAYESKKKTGNICTFYKQ